MSDVSAAALADALLAETAEATQLLTAALTNDPPLVLWLTCVTGADATSQPNSVHDVARWLSRHMLDALRWAPGDAFDVEPGTATNSEALAARVAAALELADLAAQLAAEKGEAEAERAFLCGLLYGADQWMAGADGTTADSRRAPLPRRPAGSDSPSIEWVEAAAAILAGEEPLPDGNEIDVAACRRRGVEAGQRWLTPAHGSCDRLPVLAAKLARLSTLEQQFDETLEAEKLEAMAEFAAGAGHEINNPLAVIAGRAQLFLRDETDPERRRALALMNAQAKRVYEMIADMMLFARPPAPQREPLDLGELIDGVVDDLSPQAAAQETTLLRLDTSETVGIEADKTQLAVALGAVCRNSLEALGRGGRIEINARSLDGGIEIRIADDGPGIPPEHRRHLFDPYYSARQAGRGLGLGLSKCWRIVTNHGGRVAVKSNAGQGAVFVITLPVS